MKIQKAILMILSCLLLAGCSLTITTDLNNTYKVVETNDDEGDLYLSSGSFYTVDADILRSYTDIIYSKYVSIPANAEEAAHIGASILDNEFACWSESNTVVIHFNKAANAWIIHGQLLNRYSTEKIGVVTIEASTGEVLCIVYE